MSTRASHTTGFSVSALVHGAILVALLAGQTGQSTTSVDATALALKLAMFQPAPEPAVPASEAQAAKPEAPPAEPAAPAETERPEPDEPPVAEAAQPESNEPPVAETVKPETPVPAIDKPEPPPPPVEHETAQRRQSEEKPLSPKTAGVSETRTDPEPTRENTEPRDAPETPQQPQTQPALAAAAPAASAPAARPAVDRGLIASLEAEYMAALRQAIEANKFYPKRASRLRREGSVTVDFIIDRDGVIRDVRVTESSGTRLLDRAAVEAIERLGRFQPIPSEIPHDPWSLQIPMSYKLL